VRPDTGPFRSVVAQPPERASQLEDLHAELTQYVPELEPSAGHLGFSAPLHLRTSRGELRLITTVTTFATAVDVTLAELKLEAFLPADQATADARQPAGPEFSQPAGWPGPSSEAPGNAEPA
jgi:hypothetical protein